MSTTMKRKNELRRILDNQEPEMLSDAEKQDLRLMAEVFRENAGQGSYDYLELQRLMMIYSFGKGINREGAISKRRFADELAAITETYFALRFSMKTYGFEFYEKAFGKNNEDLARKLNELDEFLDLEEGEK